jgi:DNA-binding GntR family transcriptional regulator
MNAISKIGQRTTNGKKPASGDLIANDVRTKLRSMILASEFKPGQRLVEEDLCQALRVGRTPVREALLLLQGEGYLARERGWVVQDVDRSKVHAIFASRAAIEGASARLAARRISPEACDQLMRMVDAMAPSDTLTRAQLNQLNTQFHKLVVDLADNILLSEFHERTQFYYWMLRVPILFGAHELAAMHKQHGRIVQALIDKDENEADAAAREHVEATMAIIEPALQF